MPVEPPPPVSFASVRSLWARVPHGRIARDALWNFAGSAVPMLVGLFAVPVVARHLPADDFGLLGAAWAVLGFFALLDLGLGRAAIKYVAEALALPGAPRLGSIVALSVAGHAVLGVVGGAALAALAPWLARGALGLRGAIAHDAVVVFLLLAACVPFTLLAQALRAVLEGARRFDVVNGIRMPASSLNFLLPAVAVVLGLGVPGIVATLLLVRVGVAGATWLAMRRVLPCNLPHRPDDLGRGLIPEMARFSGWVAVSSVLSPLLAYTERFVLGAVAGLSALAYYTPPAEAVTRALVVPWSVASALFPVFSAADGAGGRPAAGKLALRAVLGLTAVLAVPAVVVVAFARQLLTLWLGADFGSHGAVVLQVLVVGFFVNALAHIPHGYLQGLGRPDLTAKLHLAEVGPYLVLVWWMVHAHGALGAALAWAVRLFVDAVALGVLAWRLGGGAARRLATCPDRR